MKKQERESLRLLVLELREERKQLAQALREGCSCDSAGLLKKRAALYALREGAEQSFLSMSEKERYSAKGEAVEEELAVMEDATDLLDAALQLLRETDSPEEAAELLADAADYLSDLL